MSLRCASASTARQWLVGAFLLLLPLALYENTIGAHFGLRDDYSILRESHEEPGKVASWCAAEGRPLYGVLLERTFARLDGIDELRIARSLSALAVGFVALLAHRALRRAGWAEAQSVAVAALLALLPAAQIDVAWAICFPVVLAAVAGLGGFLLAERGGWMRRIAGAALVGCGALLYQPQVLLYVVPVAAGLVARRREPIATRARWLALHLVTLGGGLALAFAIATGLFASGVVEPAQLWSFDPHPWTKLRWFLDQPLHNALAAVVLRDDDRGPSPAYWAMAAATAGAIAIAALSELRRGLREAAFFAFCAGALALSSFAVNLVASERTPKYRTLWALTAVCVVLATQGLEVATERLPRFGRWLAPAALGLLVLAALPLARSQAYDLIALPQGRELALLEQSVRTRRLSDEPAIFVIPPEPQGTLAPLRFEDEFGSLSSASDWVPLEMLRAALEERDPSLCRPPRSCRLATGRAVPPGARYDVVIDMRRLRDLRIAGRRPSHRYASR
jgi:hypothetical protein